MVVRAERLPTVRNHGRKIIDEAESARQDEAVVIEAECVRAGSALWVGGRDEDYCARLTGRDGDAHSLCRRASAITRALPHQRAVDGHAGSLPPTFVGRVVEGWVPGDVVAGGILDLEQGRILPAIGRRIGIPGISRHHRVCTGVALVRKQRGQDRGVGGYHVSRSAIVAPLTRSNTAKHAGVVAHHPPIPLVVRAERLPTVRSRLYHLHKPNEIADPVAAGSTVPVAVQPVTGNIGNRILDSQAVNTLRQIVERQCGRRAAVAGGKGNDVVVSRPQQRVGPQTTEFVVRRNIGSNHRFAECDVQRRRAAGQRASGE